MKRLFLLVFVVACATTPSMQDIPHTFNFEMPFEEAWTAVVEVLGELDLPIETLEKDSGRINTGWFGIESEESYVDCGRQAPGDLSSFFGQINVVTRNEGEAVEVEITSTFRATMRDPANDYHYEIRCYSTGGWESLVSTRLERRLGWKHSPQRRAGNR